MRLSRQRSRRIVVLAASLAAPLLNVTPDASAQVFSWINPAGGTFSVASNWSPAGGPPNSAGKAAVFSLNALYLVTLTSSTTNEFFRVDRGGVFFASNTATPRTYSVTEGSVSNGAFLAVGGTDRPVNINVADFVTIGGGSTLTMANGSLSVDRLGLGDLGAGTLRIEGSGSRFDLRTTIGTTSIGANGSTGMLILGAGAAGTINNALTLADTNVANSAGRMQLFGSGVLTIKSGLRVGAAGAAGQSGDVLISGFSRLIQTGTGTVLIGGTTNSIGTITIDDGAAFDTATGTVTLNPLGRLILSGGSLNANGRLVSNGGQITVSSGGRLNSQVATTLNGGSMSVGGGTVSALNLFSATNANVNFTGGAFQGSGSFLLSGGTFNVSAPATFTEIGPMRLTNSAAFTLAGTSTTIDSTITATTNGVLRVNGGTFNANGALVVDGGAVEVTGGGALRSNLSTTITSGTLTLAGGAATFNALGLSNARVNVGAGASLFGPASITFAGGTLALTGNGSLNLAGRTLNLNNGATFTGDTATNLKIPGGTINITTFSQFTVGWRMDVDGFMNVTGGSSVHVEDLSIAAPASGPGGTLIVDGPGTSLSSSFVTLLGISRSGTADFRNGAAISMDSFIMGNMDGPTTAMLTLQSGADMNLNGSLGLRSGGGIGTTILNVSGPGTTLNSRGGGVDGTLSISNSASVYLDGTITIASAGFVDVNAATFQAGGSIILNGGRFRRTNGVFIHDVATIFDIRGGGVAEFLGTVHETRPSNIFHVFDGTLHFSNGVRLGTGSTGSILLDGANTRLFVGAGGATVGFGANGRGTLEIRNGGIGTFVGTTHVGMDGSSGTLLITGAGARANFADLVVGVNGGTGTASIAGTFATVGHVHVGVNGGTGNFTLSASPIAIGNITAGVDGGHGVVNLNGPMILPGDTSITVGGAAASPTTGFLRVEQFTGGTGTIEIRPGGRLTIGSLLVARGPIIDAGTNVTHPPQARMNLTNQTRFVDYTGESPIETIRAKLTSGYAGGSWNGLGIMSSLAAADSAFALGFAEASDLFGSFPATFQNRSVDATTLLITFTRYGDANLDRVINLQDFNRLAANFGSTSAVWSQGDFNYDGIVNLQDFNRLAANFGLSASADGPTPQDWSELASAVPEPAGGVLAIAGLCIAHGRRRRPRAGRGAWRGFFKE